MNIKWLIVISVLVIVLLISGIVALVSIQKRVPMHGIIKSADISVWQDQQCTIPLNEWDLGMLELGVGYGIIGYVKSEANVPIQVIFTVENFQPENATYSWYLLQTPQPMFLDTGGIGRFDFVFDGVDSMPEGIFNFSFDFVITSTER